MSNHLIVLTFLQSFFDTVEVGILVNFIILRECDHSETNDYIPPDGTDVPGWMEFSTNKQLDNIGQVYLKINQKPTVCKRPMIAGKPTSLQCYI